MSYRDKLLGFNGKKFSEWDTLSDQGDLPKDDMDEEFDEEAYRTKQAKVDWPIIPVTNQERRVMYAPWKNKVIINLLGKRVSFRFLLARLSKIWMGIQFKIVDIPNDHYMVKFYNEKDYDFVLEEGPWVIAEHYLVVQKWRPRFDPFDNSVGRMSIWARVPNIPIEYFEKHFLWKIGNYIGSTIKVDPNTMKQIHVEATEEEVKRGRFARLCVEVDFRKKLVSKVEIEEKLFAVEYEGLHSICFECGKLGAEFEQRDRVPNCEYSGFGG